MDYLKETNTNYHLFTPPPPQSLHSRVVITNLHKCILHAKISIAHAELEYSTERVNNAKNKNKAPLPLLFVGVLP